MGKRSPRGGAIAVERVRVWPQTGSNARNQEPLPATDRPIGDAVSEDEFGGPREPTG